MYCCPCYNRPSTSLFPAPCTAIVPRPADVYAYDEQDLAKYIKLPNVVVGLKSHIVPTGR